VATAGAADDEGDDREPLCVEVAEDLEARVRTPAIDGAPPEVLPVCPGHVDADRVLELEHETRADRLDDGGRSGLLSVLRVLEVAMLARVHVRDDASTDHVG